MIADPLIRFILVVAAGALFAAIAGMVWLQLGQPKHYRRVFWSSTALAVTSTILLFGIASLASTG